MDGTRDRLRSWLTLLLAPDIGPLSGAQLLARFGSPAALLQASRTAWREAGLGEAAQQAGWARTTTPPTPGLFPLGPPARLVAGRARPAPADAG
jgi:transposase